MKPAIRHRKDGTLVIPDWIAALESKRPINMLDGVSFERLESRREKLERENGPGWTRGEWEALKALYGGKCLDCGTTRRIVPDHIIPLSVGGIHHISNIQPLCYRCNFKKQLRSTDFRPALKMSDPCPTR